MARPESLSNFAKIFINTTSIPFARLQSLLTARALDKQALSSLEKRLVEEKKAKSTLETLLARERKARRAAEESAAKLSSVGCGDALCRGKRREVEAAKVTNGGCADAVCRGKRRELEVESRQWKREADERRERCAAAENELQVRLLNFCPSYNLYFIRIHLNLLGGGTLCLVSS